VPPIGGGNPHSAHAALTVTAQLDHGASVLVVVGELDMLTAPQLSQALDVALGAAPPVLVVDLSGITFMDSAGLAVLLSAHREAGDGTSLRVVANQRATLRPMQLTGVDEYLALYPRRRDALAD
jgi:anti-sigma B factor antagonist